MTKRYKCHRAPSSMIAHAAGSNFRFCLGDRDIEALSVARGVTLTYEAIRK
jgi:hypothetical protein